MQVLGNLDLEPSGREKVIRRVSKVSRIAAPMRMAPVIPVNIFSMLIKKQTGN